MRIAIREHSTRRKRRVECSLIFSYDGIWKINLIKPRSDQSRASDWHVLRWAEALYIENILIENVPEFLKWGPLDEEGRPVERLAGKTFLSFISALQSLDYEVSWRVINCADYGDPTIRKRLFIQARKKKTPTWPEPTHAPREEVDMFSSRKPYSPAREIIDWTLEGESIYERDKPLSENTLRRIEAGIHKFNLQLCDTESGGST